MGSWLKEQVFVLHDPTNAKEKQKLCCFKNVFFFLWGYQLGACFLFLFSLALSSLMVEPTGHLVSLCLMAPLNRVFLGPLRC